MTESAATREPRIAILIPCRDEATTVARVIAEFRSVLPRARVWVCDNASTDDTAAVARDAGACVVAEPRAGKGHAVRRLFAVADADVHVLVDGDATYSVASAPAMIRQLADEHLDMIVARRVVAPATDAAAEAVFRRGHAWGNRAFADAVSRLFGYRLHDVFSGYRVLTADFVHSFPALSGGFEIELELTVHALELGLAVREVPTPYGARPAGSESKLSTFRDGTRIALTLAHLYEQVKPARFFGAVALALAAISLALGLPIVAEYARTGLVPRFPTAILASAVMLLATIAATCGIVLDGVGRGRREAKRLAYMRLKRARRP